MNKNSTLLVVVAVVAVVAIGFVWHKYGPTIDIQWTPTEEPYVRDPVIDSLYRENSILQDSIAMLARRAASAGMVRVVNQVRYDTIVIHRDTTELLHSLQLLASIPPIPR